MDKILSQAENDAIESFYSNELLREAVKKVILYGVYNNGTLKEGEPADPTKNFALSLFFSTQGQVTNEALGADLRAIAEGIQAVENAFNQMKGIKKAVASEPKANKAR